MILGVPTEVDPQERRVAIVPAVMTVLSKLGVETLLEAGAGQRAGYADKAYTERGVKIAANRAEVFAAANIVVHVQPPRADFAAYRSGQIVLGLLSPLGSPETMRQLAERGVTVFALELLPRITRAQSMDALTAMATVAGYKAVLLAAEALDKMFPLLMTAAGTITPANVLIVGAGVAGLQAIATARRLGAVVHAYDVRPAVKEQVESLGAKFLDLGLTTKETEGAGGYARAMDEEFYRRQREAMTRAVAAADVVITTAAVPGKKAPVLITTDMVKGMRSGSVLVDLAAETGGNCELTRAGETQVIDGVTLLGPVNLAATVPHDGSQMYARTITAFLQNLIKKGELQLNTEDQIIRDTLVARDGKVVHPRVAEMLGIPPG
jgi:NAD(P) transhydrogenase subunit alpha